MALQIKRGTNFQRLALVLAQGEPFFVTDHAALGVSPMWVGDGTTYGGVTSVAPVNFTDLSDVTITSVASGDLLNYDVSTGQWRNSQNQTVPGNLIVAGSTTVRATDITALTTVADVNAVATPLSLEQKFSTSIVSYSSITIVSSQVTVNGAFSSTELVTGAKVKLSAVGTLVGLSTSIYYFIFGATSTSFKLATSFANAIAGIGFSTTGTGSAGTATLQAAIGFGVGQKYNLELVTGSSSITVGRTEVKATNVGIGTQSADYALFLMDAGTLESSGPNAYPQFKVTSAGNAEIKGNATINGNVYTDTIDIDPNAGASGATVFNTATGQVDVAGASTVINIGSTSGTTTVKNALTANGNFTVGASQVTANATTGDVVLATTTATSNQDSGGLQVKGGVGIKKGLWVGGEINVDSQANATSGTTGSIQTDGGLGVALDAFVAGKLTVGGDLTVNGTTTTVNSTTVTIDDPIFTLGGDTAPSSDDNKDRGIEFRYHTGAAAKRGFFGWDDSASVFTVIPDATNTSEVFSGSAGNVLFGDIEGSGALLGNVQVASGANNNTITTASGNLILNSATGILQLQTTGLDAPATAINLFDTPTTLNFGRFGGQLVKFGTSGEPPCDMYVWGALTVNTALDINGSSTLGNTIATDTTDVAGRFSVNTNDIYVSPSTHKIGFGTSSPAEKVDVVGNIGVTGYIQSVVGTNDYWRISGGGSSNAGYLEISTGDDGTEPIYFTQYTGASVTNQITLLDGSGNTTFPKNVTVGNDLIVTDDLTVQGDNVNLAQSTTIGYNENNDRANRPEVQSTSGNSSGFRVMAPNATTSAQSNSTVFGSNDIDNGEFLNLRATGSTSAPFSVRIGKYTAGVLGASGKSINFTDNVTTYASVNPSGPTVGTDLTTKTYVDGLPDNNTTYAVSAETATGGANLRLTGSDSTTDDVKIASGTNVTVTRTDANTVTIAATDTNTTYTQNISSTSGGANLNLVGSDSTTDTVKFADGTGVTVSYTDASTATIAIGQAVGTGNSPTFAGVTAGNLTVGVATDNTIASTDTNGNITLDPNGTGVIVFDGVQRLRGEAQASTNNSYVFPANTLTTATDNNGYSAASSFEPNTLGYGANAQYIHYYGDSLAAANLAPALNFRAAEGNSVTGVNLPWLGTNSVAPSAILSGTVLGTHNFNGYATSAFTNDIATQYQGGGTGTSHVIQTQGYAAENLVDGTLTLTSANITAVASSFRVALTTPAVTGTKGQISFGTTTPNIGAAIRVTGTLTGTATGIVSGQNYWIIATNSSTTATLAATPNGPPIDTTAGTLTGLTLTRCGATFTLAGQTSYPFGRNALVTVANVTNITDGTYPVSGLVSSLTSITLGIPHTVAPTLPGTQQFSIPTVTNAGGGYRIRALPLATPLNPANRLNIVDHTAASCTLRANTFTLNTGAYANTGIGVTGDKIVYNRVYGQFQYATTVTPVAADTAYVFPLGTADVNNIATVGSTSRLIPGAAGIYNLQFSVQVDNVDNANDHDAYIWLRKNGTDVVGSMGRTTVPKNNAGSLQIIAWNYIVSSANTTDYWEIAYAVSDTDVTFPAFAATAFGPSTACIITSLVPVGA